MQICNWPPDPADELCSLVGRRIHWKQHQISNHCSLLTKTNPLPALCLQVKMIAIQNQSWRVTCASIQPFLYLQGNNMHRLRIKKSNDKSEFSWWTWRAIDQPRSQNELGRADLHGSWQWGGHIQSHLTHSALTPHPWRCCPCVNSHLQGSIALDRRLGPLVGVLRAMEGGGRGEEAAGGGWPRKAGPWPKMMRDLYWNWIWRGQRDIGT